MDNLFPTWGDTTSACGSIIWSRTGIGCPRTTHDGPALWVTMRPSMFLRLASPLPVPRESLGWLRMQAAQGHTLCPPSLRCHVPMGSGIPLVTWHDGRHRATLAQSLLDDGPIPVRLLLAGPGTSQAMATGTLVRRGMRAQRTALHVAGPLFEDEFEEDEGQFRSGVPPPRGTPSPTTNGFHAWTTSKRSGYPENELMGGALGWPISGTCLLQERTSCSWGIVIP